MTHITAALTSFGFSATEAAVYEAGLRQGACTVATLSRLLGMNRATTYHHLHVLEQRGLAHKRMENGRLVVTMAREEGLRALFNFEEAQYKERKERLLEVCAKLPAPKAAERMPDVQYFSGLAGIRMALEIAFRTKSTHWDILAPKKNFFSDIDEAYAAYYLKERKDRRITSRSLWEKTSENVRVSRDVIKERQPRFIPKVHMLPFHAVLILFDTRALFISSVREMQAVLINSADISSTLQMQFNVLWELSEVPASK